VKTKVHITPDKLEIILHGLVLSDWKWKVRDSQVIEDVKE